MRVTSLSRHVYTHCLLGTKVVESNKTPLTSTETPDAREERVSGEKDSSTRVLKSLWWIQKLEPIRWMRRQESHGLAFVESKSDATRVPQQIDKLLEQRLVSFDQLECG